MAYKVYIDAGHGGSDSGAVKYMVEKDVNLVMALACRQYLVARGIKVKMSRTKDVDTDLQSLCNEANKWGADLAISCHNNGGGGKGFEIYHTVFGGKGKTMAKNIEAEVKRLGQNSRGLKTKEYSKGLMKDYFGFIRLTNCPAVICEGFFVDNREDVKLVDTKKKQKEFGYAYARGILKTLGVKDVPVTKVKKAYQGQLPKGVLQLGSKGAEVGKWQAFLKWYGYKISIDNIFGSETLALTRRFQKAKGISVDGIVGKITLSKAKNAKK